MTNRPTTVRRRKTTKNPFAAIILVALVIIAVVGIILYAIGCRYISDAGVKFIGFVKDGQPVKGTVKYQNGLSGELTKQADSAFGRIVYSTGDVYEGEIKGILRHGEGTITIKSTDEVCKGSFVNDKLTGYVECVSPNGAVYTGEVVDGNKHGVGKYIYPDGSYYYGQFQNNKRNGLGEQHNADGSAYYGSFVDDKKQGTEVVTFTLEDGSVYTGKCKQVFSNGDVYVGDYFNDRRTGKGKYVWATGHSYEGDFLNDMLHGTGAYDFNNGKAPYVGEFENGQPVVSEE